MRIVVDTNVVISGLLWTGPPQQLINLARARKIDLYSSLLLIAELAETIGREQFASRIRAAGLSAAQLIEDYASLARVVIPAEIRPAVLDDPDDDQVLACALASQSDLIVSGDKGLRRLKVYHGMPIVSTADALARLKRRA
ncbi:MAG: putative toxin-antitoxin system toxin component, PIN family [Betaproteobacteria bacterium]|nr:MAG: putative toxin-antitoxin system toxin component, PIN family [Betaproteobacteria bacterium]